MPPQVPYEKRYWYDHMAKGDVVIWERFLAAYPDYFDSVQYDFPVGPVPEHALDSVVDGGGSMGRLYQKKIDVVGRTIGAIYVVEIKPTASAATVGQTLGYLHLYQRHEKPERETRGLVITGSIDPVSLEFANAQGVAVIVV